MPYVRSAHALPGIEKLVELFEYTPSQHDPVGVTLYLYFVAAGVDFDAQRPFDQAQCLFTVAVEGNRRRVVVEGQALGRRCMFSSQ